MDERVLVVEDEPVIQRILSLFLRRGGFEVEIARNGDEGVRAALRLRPALVLMDADLPVLDGWSAAAQIKAQVPEIPVLMLTGYSTPESIARAHEVGCAGLLGKPFDFDHMLDAVRACITGPSENPVG